MIKKGYGHTVERTSFSNTPYAIAQIINVVRDIPDAVGDFDLCFVEFFRPPHRNDNDFWEEPFTMRMAPVHAHITSRSLTTTASNQQLEQMMDLGGGDDPEVSEYLTLLDHLFLDPPNWMAKKELSYISGVRERSDGCYIVRVSPITLHFAGPFIYAQFDFDLFEQILPIRQQPKNPHSCWLQRKGRNMRHQRFPQRLSEPAKTDKHCQRVQRLDSRISYGTFVHKSACLCYYTKRATGDRELRTQVRRFPSWSADTYWKKMREDEDSTRFAWTQSYDDVSCLCRGNIGRAGKRQERKSVHHYG
jgi:hypothetical protein